MGKLAVGHFGWASVCHLESCEWEREKGEFKQRTHSTKQI